jgi:hypothetical protein
MKHWRALDKVIPNTQIPFVGDYVRIVCALCNAFRSPLIKDTSNDDFLASRMLALLKNKNHLQERVIEEGLDRQRATWVEMDESSFEDFPKLDYKQLRELTLGIYQLKQARSYTQEHLSDTGSYNVFLHKQNADVLRVKIQSRHVASKVHNLWISYDHSDITGWYCQCRAGARVIGCCAHISSVVWYLSHARHNLEVVTGPASGMAQYVDDAADLSSGADSDWDASGDD